MKQKLQTVLVTGMIFLAANTFGQTNTYLDLMINVVSTNLNYGDANKSLADYKKSTNGIQAGVSFQAGITPAFSIVPELYYMRKGGKLKVNNPITTNESSLRLNTLELPLLGRLHMGRFYVNAGPSIAYNLSGKNTMGDLSTKLSFNNTDGGFKRWDAGVQMGGGVEFPFKQKRIAIDIRYSYGLSDISYDREIHNRAVMVSVHFSKAWLTNPLGRN
ncbi:porin family protein [Ferruginibacter paludis]|uniref:porin family protein n=1 Tax=Ferruginibacter paludis TaxID=1310417 RepID=UPI0025B4F6F3|nr:porin family protein [Ferruginibacter paludis]MDN3654198.1 porin family protein [Ferruginibacter paludis]